MKEEIRQLALSCKVSIWPLYFALRSTSSGILHLTLQLVSLANYAIRDNSISDPRIQNDSFVIAVTSLSRLIIRNKITNERFVVLFALCNSLPVYVHTRDEISFAYYWGKIRIENLSISIQFGESVRH